MLHLYVGSGHVFSLWQVSAQFMISRNQVLQVSVSLGALWLVIKYYICMFSVKRTHLFVCFSFITINHFMIYTNHARKTAFYDFHLILFIFCRILILSETKTASYWQSTISFINHLLWPMSIPSIVTYEYPMDSLCLSLADRHRHGWSTTKVA